MSKIFLTNTQKKIIEINYLIKGIRTISKEIGVSPSVVNKHLKENNLVVPEELKKTFINKGRKVKSCLEPYDEYIKQNYLTIPAKTMSRNIGVGTEITIRTRMRQLGLVVPPEIIKKFRESSYFKKGSVPPNKGKTIDEYMSPEVAAKVRLTAFKKGNVPKNTIRKPGTITVRTYGSHEGRRGYKIQFIQLEDFTWLPLHIFNWIKSGSEIPEGFILWFKDGNNMNADVSNLELITRKESMLRNSIQNYPKDLIQVLQLKSKLIKMLNNNQNER